MWTAATNSLLCSRCRRRIGARERVFDLATVGRSGAICSDCASDDDDVMDWEDGEFSRPTSAATRFAMLALQARRDGYQDGHRKGWSEGYAQGFAQGAMRIFPPDVLRKMLKLCHPDHQPSERQAMAHEVTTAILSVMKD